MFNVAVINIKDITKYLLSVIMIIVIITGVTRYFKDAKQNANTTEISKNIEGESMLLCLENTIPGIENIASNNNDTKVIKNNDDDSILAKILKVELGIFEITENEDVASIAKPNIITNEIAEEENTVNETPNGEVSTNVQTQVVTQNPLADRFTNEHGKVKIKNETSYEITEDIFTTPLSLQNKNIIIFHTHTCESYTPSETYPYQQTGNYRTTDKNYSVSRVGDELEKYLSQYGYNVIHDTTYHDYPAYTGSYTRSLETVNNILKSQDAEIIIDLHRDAIGSNSNYAPTVKIGDEYAAQLMFVIGTDGGGLWHPNWRKNLQFAVAVQQKAEEMYPGLFKTMILRNSRYNQHLGEAACIIEVGATGNTLEQCLTSQKYLAKVIDETLK